MGQADTMFARRPLRSIHAAPLPRVLDRAGSPAASKALGKSVVDRFSDPATARFHTEETSFLAADPWPATIFLSASRENGAEHALDPSSNVPREINFYLFIYFFFLIRASDILWISSNILYYFRHCFKERNDEKHMISINRQYFYLLPYIFLSRKFTKFRQSVII